jgi:hypothetical protein
MYRQQEPLILMHSTLLLVIIVLSNSLFVSQHSCRTQKHTNIRTQTFYKAAAPTILVDIAMVTACSRLRIGDKHDIIELDSDIRSNIEIILFSIRENC